MLAFSPRIRVLDYVVLHGPDRRSWRFSIYCSIVRPPMEHSMEESSTAPLPSTTTPPQQQLPNSKCPNTSATNLQASEASHTARVSWACGCHSCLNNDIRRTISPRSNLPSRRYFRSTTQRRLLTLSRPWQIGRHLRRQQPLSSHFSSSPTCPSKRHTFNVPVLHILYRKYLQ